MHHVKVACSHPQQLRREVRDAADARAAIAEAARLGADAAAQAGHPRSLGTGDEAASLVALAEGLAPFDACATVVEGLALALASLLTASGHAAGRSIVVAGGSARHRMLRERLAEHASSEVETSDEHAGIPVEMREAAAMVKRLGQRVAANVKVAMVVPGSGQVKAQAEAEGLHEVFKAAGFQWREPGCSMCLAMNADRLEPGERCASTSNRNFEGRQGAGGRTHLVSPAMAAAAAVHGHFVDVRRFS
jgi:hypothetical protein